MCLGPGDLTKNYVLETRLNGYWRGIEMVNRGGIKWIMETIFPSEVVSQKCFRNRPFLVNK